MTGIEIALMLWGIAGILTVVIATWRDDASSWHDFTDGAGLTVLVLAIILWPLAIWFIASNDD